MKGFTRFVSHLFAYLFLLLFLFALPFSLLIFNLGRVIFDHSTLKSLLSDTLTQTQLVSTTLAWYSEEVAVSLPLESEVALDVAVVFSSLDQEAWQAIQEELIPDAIVIEWVSNLVDDFHLWLDSADAFSGLYIDMVPLKAQIDSDHGLRTLEIAYQVLPFCTAGQISDFESTLQNASSGTNVYYPPCQFPDPYQESQLTAYLRNTREIIANIPDEMRFPGAESQPETQAQQNNPLHTFLRLARTFYWLTPVIPLVLLLMIWWLVIRNTRDFARWWGISLTLGGISTLILGWLGRIVFLNLLVGNAFRRVPETILPELQQVVEMMVEPIYTPMMVEAVIILLIGGMVLVIVGGMMGRSQVAGRRERSANPG